MTDMGNDHHHYFVWLFIICLTETSKALNFNFRLFRGEANYACLQPPEQFVLMRQLIVAVPCVYCCGGSRRYSTWAWHQCLLQFHLIALVIKLGTDTTHHIIALITSEPHCVHMTISLAETTIASLPLRSCPSVLLSLLFSSQIWPSVSLITRRCPVPVQGQTLFPLQWFFQGLFPLPNMQNDSSSGQVCGGNGGK